MSFGRQEFGAFDLGAVEALLRATGRSEIMPRFRRLQPEAIRVKSGPLDLVTDADMAAEAAITAGLLARFPGCLVVGEEAAAADPGLQARLGTASLAFVVDPIDGTSNYAAGLPVFGTMAAAILGGRVVASCIHDPVTGASFLALDGQGAFSLDSDGTRRKLRVCAPAPLADMTGTLAWRYLPEPRRGTALRGALSLAGAWDFRCAAHHYRMLAEGQCHFSFYNRLMPWDHAPGWLLHRQAGGYAAKFDGSPYNPCTTIGGLICAPDKPTWTTLREVLLGESKVGGAAPEPPLGPSPRP